MRNSNYTFDDVQFPTVPQSFKDIFVSFDWEEERKKIYNKSPAEVEQAIENSINNRCTIDDFQALVSPIAGKYLEKITQQSHLLTLKRFGATMQLYAPLYLSNECQNICTYCGFSFNNKIPRKTLNLVEIEQEMEALQSLGIRHILLVTGEANKTVGTTYLAKAIALAQHHFDNVSIEVQPLDRCDYEQLIKKGLNTVLVYQETYHKTDYKKHHLKGKKTNFIYRLETPDRLGKAGIHKIGLGALIGLEDWRVDSFFVALHVQYLERKYWKTKYSISFPRLRPFSGGLAPKVDMNDSELVQLIGAYRLFNQEVELSLSTRESEHFRNHAFKLGITSMSAGSKTNPGGYSIEPASKKDSSLKQFEISDNRSPQKIAEMLTNKGYEVVWKDWEKAFQVLN